MGFRFGKHPGIGRRQIQRVTRRDGREVWQDPKAAMPALALIRVARSSWVCARDVWSFDPCGVPSHFFRMAVLALRIVAMALERSLARVLVDFGLRDVLRLLRVLRRVFLRAMNCLFYGLGPSDITRSLVRITTSDG